MRHLIVMRHAKAERGDGKADFDRTLENRGWDDAARVGAALAASGHGPDLILCSSSRRTRDTLAAVLPFVSGDCVVHLRRDLYDAEVSDLAEGLRAAPEADTVLLIGHNPSVHGLVVSLAGSGRAAGEVRGGFPTSTAAVFDVSGGLDEARLLNVVSP